MNHPNLYEQIKTDLEEMPQLANHVDELEYAGGDLIGWRFYTSAGRCIEIHNFWDDADNTRHVSAEDWTDPDNSVEFPLPWAAVCWGQLKMRANYDQRTAC